MTEPEQPVVAVPLRAARALTAEEAVEKALLFTFQLANKDYRKFQVAMTEVAFIRALEQDGYTVAALAVEAVRPETTLTPEALDEWYEQTRPEPAVRPETDPLNEMIGVGQYEVHSPDDGHDHVTDGDGSIIAIRPDTDIDEERLALALWAHDEKQSPYPSVQQAPDDYHRKLARNIAAIYRATPLAERPE